MRRITLATSVALALAVAGTSAFAQGVAPGGPIGGSTAIGSGLGGINGTGPSWPNGTNQAPQPSIPSVPPGGYASPAPSSTYTPSPSAASPSTSRPSPYPQPRQPFESMAGRPPAAIPLTLPDRASGSVAFLKGCWRTDVFSAGQHPGTTTWCFDDRGGGRFLYARIDQPSYSCSALAEAHYDARQLHLQSLKTSCSDGSAESPGTLACREGTDGALCSADAGGSWTVRLYRVR